MRNVRVRLAYDGSKFFGWQRQAGFPSVQEAVEDALAAIVGERVTVHGAGRTDTGVHALGQVAHFHVATAIGDERLRDALNAHLCLGAVVRDLETCPGSFHAQRDASSKRYGYLVRTTRFRPPFGREFCHWMPEPLDVAAMRAAAVHLRGEHDFTALANAGSPRKSNVRVLSSVRLVARRQSLALFLEGKGFLYNMARTIAGTLIDVGRGKLAPDDVRDILAARDRTRAGPTAPAAGLYLLRVRYPEPCFSAGRRGRHAGGSPAPLEGGKTPP